MGAVKILRSKYSARYSAKAGSIMPVFAISLMAMVSLASAAIALTVDSKAASQLQATADSAALGGATAFVTSTKPRAEDRLAEAHAQAEALALGNSDYYLADLDIASISEDAYGQRTRINVALQFDPVNIMAKFAGRNGNIAIRRTAVAEATLGFPLCVLTLAENETSLTVKGNASLIAKNCIIWSNSTDSRGMTFSGGTSEAKYFCSAGGSTVSGGASVRPNPQESCQTIPDPMRDWVAPASGMCMHTDLRVTRNSSMTLRPGVYCDGIEIRSASVEFDPGIYVIRDGPLIIKTEGDLIADGVTFILEGEISDVDISSDAGLTLIAPAGGPTAGIAIAEGEIVTTNFPNSVIRGGLNVEGVLYMPHYDLELKDTGGGNQRSPYLQMVVNTLLMRGQSHLNIDFNQSKTSLPLVIKPARTARLVD